MKRCIGIDLGTSNSCVATIDESGRPRILPNRMEENTTPSVVSFAQGPEHQIESIVGAAAIRRSIQYPKETLYGVKRLIGRRLDDPEVQALASTLPFKIVSAPNGDAWVEIHGMALSPQEVSATILTDLCSVAEEHYGAPVEEAILTVPAHFDNAQRKATADAAAIAGLKVRRILNEPTAAALGYGAHRGSDQRLAVCDLGGGTFDVSIVNVEDGIIEVISSQGDLFLGGDDVDRMIIKHLLTEIYDFYGVDVSDDPVGLQRLKVAVIAAKHTLSEARSASIELLHLGMQSSGKALDYRRTIERAELNTWVAPIIARIEAPCLEAVARCGISPRDVDAIVLVGGMTRMPSIQNQIASIFGRPPLKVVNPDEIVAIGAATQCAILDGRIDGAVLLDVTSRALGLLSDDGEYQQVIPRNATIPTREHRIIATSKDDQGELYFEVYEGETGNPRVNRQLGRFVCRDLPEAKAGEVMILVEFTVDVDGILRVSTSELGTGSPQELRVIATAGLTRSELKGIQKHHFASRRE